MGLWETLDKSCAVLLEAGYPDPWSWTPRQIMHRLEVHNWVRDQAALRELEVGILASRGEGKHLKEFEEKTRARHATTPEQTGLETRAAPAAVESRLRAEHSKLPWSARG